MRDTHTEVRDPAAPLPPVDPPPADPATNPGREVDPPAQANEPTAPDFSDGDTADQETTARPADEPTDLDQPSQQRFADRPSDADPATDPNPAPADAAQYETQYEQAQYDRAPEYAEPDGAPTQPDTVPDGDDRFAEDRLVEERIAQDRDERIDATDADQPVDNRSHHTVEAAPPVVSSEQIDSDRTIDGNFREERPSADFGAATPVAASGMGDPTDRESYGEAPDSYDEVPDRAVDAVPVMNEGRDTTRTDEASTDRAPGEVSVAPLPDLWPAADAESFRARWRDLQLTFVDDPQGAARQADALVGDAVEALTRALATQRSDLASWQSDNASDTEQLRVAVQRYHTFLDNLLGV